MSVSLAVVVLLAAIPAASAELYWVHGSDVSAAVDAQSGHIVRLNNSAGWSRQVLGRSWVTDGTFEVESVAVEFVASGAVLVRRVVAVQGYGFAALQSFEATLIDLVTPADIAVGGLEWKLTVETTSEAPWRAVVATEVVVVEPPAAPPLEYWLPTNGNGMADDVLAMRNVSSEPFADIELGTGYAHGIKTSGHMPFPLFVWAGHPDGGSADGGGGGLVIAPRLINDTTLAATADLNSTAMQYRRYFNRLSANQSWSWTTHLGALAPPDPAAVDPRFPASDRGDDPWRDALRFAVAVSPAVFHPVQSAAATSGEPTSLSEVGMGLYTCSPATALNLSTTVKHAGGTTLWDASFWWPYMGLFLPPVANTTVSWASNFGGDEEAVCTSGPGGFQHGDFVSAETISGHLTQMSELGVTVPLSYFNLFEFGQNIRWPLPKPLAGCAADATPLPARCWNDSSVLLASALADAVLFESTITKPTYTWQDAVVLDPGVESYRMFLVAQAQRHFELLGRAFRGVVIDRTDHTSKTSWARDDGMLWCGAPCASMLPAWLAASADVAAAVHGGATSGLLPPPRPDQLPLVMINYGGSARAELLTHADGIFSESGDELLNSIGLSAIAMPAIGWTYPAKRAAGQLDHAYMQRHLRMGVQPMAPAHGADHSVGDGDAAVVALYMDYGPLFKSIRATRWGLDRSHVIRVHPPAAEGGPMHNVFSSLVPRSTSAPWVVVLALADANVDSVHVTLKLPLGGQPVGCEVLLPGVDAKPEPATVLQQTQRPGQEVLLQLKARLLFGCAVLECGLESSAQSVFV